MKASVWIKKLKEIIESTAWHQLYQTGKKTFGSLGINTGILSGAVYISAFNDITSGPNSWMLYSDQQAMKRQEIGTTHYVSGEPEDDLAGVLENAIALSPQVITIANSSVTAQHVIKGLIDLCTKRGSAIADIIKFLESGGKIMIGDEDISSQLK
jgi:hypothetical protein